MWQSRIVTVALVIASAAFAAAPACDRAGPGPDDSKTTSDPADRSDGFLESKGETCSRDLDCSGYLRCLDETCRIPPAVRGEADEETPRVRFHADDSSREPLRYHVELATTAAERRRGLMYRPKMQKGWGMLFVYPTVEKRSFWMKNTYIPLDMIFMDGAGTVVNVVHDATPETTTPRRSKKPAKYVLELNAGVAERAGIERGDQMTVEKIPDRYAPAP